LIVIEGSVPLQQPTLSLVKGGQNVLTNAKAYRPVTNNNGDRIWHYLLNSNNFPDGAYAIHANAKTADGRDVASRPINMSIKNSVELSLVSGQIIMPQAGQTVAGNVRLAARVEGEIRSLAFKIQTPANGTLIVPAIFEATSRLWQATWNTVALVGGQLVIGADVISSDGGRKTLPSVTALLTETPATTSAPEPEIDQVIEPILLQSPDDVASLAAECRLIRITDQAACNEYLRLRNIRQLSVQEQEQVREQLSEVTTRHIAVGDGLATQKDFTREFERGSVIQDPLAEIIPLDKSSLTKRNYLVYTSTEPATSVKPFIQQTVPALLILDQDGDGLSDDAEERYGTDSNNADSDGDGFDDGT